MVRSFAIVLMLAASWNVTMPVHAQDAKHWPLAKISFPVDVAKIQSLDPKPVRLRFYAAPPRGRFELIAEKRIEELDELIDNQNRDSRRGFTYVARGDGTEEFALQYVYANGDVNPPTGSLSAQYRIAFDTRPPLIRINANAATGVSWVVEDENLNLDSVRLEVKYPTQTEWSTVMTRSFSARDSYNWRDIPSNRTLEVRVSAKDKAGHEGRSAVVKLPTNAIDNNPLENTSPLTRPGIGTGARSASGFGDDVTGVRPQIEYVNTNKLNVRTRFPRVTRSGIKESVLWVNDGRIGWKEDSRKQVNITVNDKDPFVEMPYAAPKDGLYGFIVLPVNGAGGKPDDPREGDPAQWLVEVDTIKPVVDVKNIRVLGGGLNGPKVEIDWTAMDKNLMPEPITLEYANDPAAKDWQPIAAKIANSGRYTWEVEDKNLWKFYVRATAVDKAGNSERVVYKDAVLVDLEKPSAIIEKVNGAGAPSATRNYEPNLNERIPPTKVPVISPAEVRPTEQQPELPKPAPKTTPVIVPKPEQPTTPKVITPEPIPKPPDIKLPDPSPTPTLPGAPMVPELPPLPGIPKN